MATKLSVSNIKQIYAPSLMQESMLDSTLDTAGNQTYFRQMAYQIEGDLQPGLMEAALAVLARRHDSLRTLFSRKKEDRWLQIVLNDWSIGFYFDDLRERGDLSVREAYAGLYKTLDRKKGFDCTKDPLMRVAVLQIDDHRFELIWSYHHAIVDGWSISTLLKEYLTVYTSLATGQSYNLPEPVQFGAYIGWLQEQDKAESEQYWKSYLADYTKATGLPKIKLPATTHPGFRNAMFTIPTAQMDALTALAKRNKTTFSVLIQAVWGILLSKLNQTQDAVFGLVVSGRPPVIEGVEAIVGLFINTVPVRIRYTGETTVADLLTDVQTQAFEREAHEYCAPPDIQAQSDLKQNLYDHILAFDNFPTGEQLTNWSDAPQATNRFAITNAEHVALTDYDFNVSIRPGPETTVRFDYNENAYESFVVEGLVGQFQYILTQLVANETVRIDALSLVTPAEQDRLLHFNPAPCVFSPFNTLVEQLAVVTNTYADKPAVVGSEQQLTYAELDQVSNQLARHLIQQGVRPQNFVAVRLDRSEKTVVSLLAILKIGAVYVPIDKDLPPARVDFMLNDTQAALLITDHLQLGLSINIREILYTSDAVFDEQSSDALPAVGQSTDIAYVIYTSGTSGTPKGVLIKQESILDRILYHNDHLSITADDVILQFSSVSFDASLVEIFMALLAGGTLVIADKVTKYNPALLLDVLDQQKVTVAIFPPAYLQAFDGKPLASLRTLISTGEAASLALSVNYAANLDFFNGYGPTEACVGATFYQVDARKTAVYSRMGGIPIGQPFANTAVYVVNEQLGLMPVGFVGEICVTGKGLSAGYLNQPDLTREKFVPNPYATSSQDAVLYRTGDLGRWNSEGVLEFIGRKDDQIQVRGIRVEPAEIEGVLIKHEAVKSALIDVRQTEAGVQLIAYVIAEALVSVTSLRDFAARWLPTYMLPTHVVQLDAFPLTINGKVDRKQLPKPDALNEERAEKPIGAVEQRLADIWMAILDKTELGRHTNFFEIGGHSLKATRLISRIYREMGVKLTLNDVFLYPTPAQMAALIEKTATTGYERIRPCPEQDVYPLSYAQKGVWLAHQFDEARLAYNVTAAYWLTGDLDVAALEKALHYVVRRHEILRTNFSTDKGVPVQNIQRPEAARFTLTHQDVSQYALSSHSEALRVLNEHAQTAFDLQNDSLIKATLVRTANDEWLFILMMHHIICDAWSKDVLTRDIITAYNAYTQQEPVGMEALPIQYKDFTAWQQANFSDDQSRAGEYWLKKVANFGEPTILPTDYPRPSKPSYAGAVQLTHLPQPLVGQLRQLAQQSGTSLFTIGLAAVYALIYQCTGQEDLLVGTTVAGRDHDNLDEQIGFYVNTLVLRTGVAPTDSFETLLQRTKETTLEAYQHQHYPFDRLKALALRNPAQRSLFAILVELITVAGGSDKRPDMTGVEVVEHVLETSFSKHELAFRFFDNGTDLTLSLEYNSDLYNPATINLFTEQLLVVLETAANTSTMPLADLFLASADATAAPAMLDDSFNFTF